MIFKHRYFRLIAILGALFFILLYHIGVHFGLYVDGLFFGLSMVLIGIPHGAVDHLIDRKVNGKNHSTAFYSFYFLSIGLMALLWTFSKPLGFIFFLLITVYHFGITDVQRLTFLSSKKRKVAGIGRGLFIISILLLANPQETFNNVSNIIGQTLYLPIFLELYSSLIVFGTLFLFSLIMLSLYSYNIRNKEIREFFVDSLFLSLIFLTTSTTVGFAIYFSLWHSLKHLEEIYDFKNESSIYSGLKSFYKDALPFSLVSFVGILFLFSIFSYFELQQNIISVSLILVSALTLPHVVIVEQFYGANSIKE